MGRLQAADEFLLGRTVDYGLAVLLGLVEGYEDTTFGIFRPVPTMKENILESLDVEYHGEDAAELRGIAQDYAVVPGRDCRLAVDLYARRTDCIFERVAEFNAVDSEAAAGPVVVMVLPEDFEERYDSVHVSIL